MAISAKSDPVDESLLISIVGRFDFSSHNDFRNTYESLAFQPKSVTVDMKQASFVDSSALGMLLILRDYCGKESADIAIVNCSDDVMAIFQQANFSDLFNIG